LNVRWKRLQGLAVLADFGLLSLSAINKEVSL